MLVRIFVICMLLSKCVFTSDSWHKKKTTFIVGMELVSLRCDREFTPSESIGLGWYRYAIATQWFQFHTTNAWSFKINLEICFNIMISGTFIRSFQVTKFIGVWRVQFKVISAIIDWEAKHSASPICYVVAIETGRPNYIYSLHMNGISVCQPQMCEFSKYDRLYHTISAYFITPFNRGFASIQYIYDQYKSLCKRFALIYFSSEIFFFTWSMV